MGRQGRLSLGATAVHVGDVPRGIEDGHGPALGSRDQHGVAPRLPCAPAQVVHVRVLQDRQQRAVRDLRAIPHEAHGAWAPPKNRPGAVDTVLAGNDGRQESLLPLRMGRMAASPFAFLRGAASVMAWDLSHTAVSGPQVMIDGDAHINNFGLFGTPQREGFSASPVAVEGKIFFTNDDGDTFVLRAGPKFDLMHVHRMNERTLASPALVDGRWYIRTAQHLYAIGK